MSKIILNLGDILRQRNMKEKIRKIGSKRRMKQRKDRAEGDQNE